MNHLSRTSSERAAAFLDRLAGAPKQSRHGGERGGLRTLLQRAGEPHKELRSIRIAGSKGKGSTGRLMEAMLARGGVRTGLFTSPHLQHWNERIRLDGKDVDNGELANVLEELGPDIDTLRADPAIEGPDFFEVCLVAALVLFHRARCDIAILECGIGARGDATAVIQPLRSVITTVELEHAQLIGPRLEDIAREKSGVMHNGTPTFIGNLPEGPLRVVQKAARDEHAVLKTLGRDFHITRENPARLSYHDAGGDLPLRPGPSLYRLADNAALAIATLRSLVERPSDEAIMDALDGLQLPGCLEVVPGQPTLVIDGAHTRASSELLAGMLAGMGKAPRTLVISSTQGHDAGSLSPTLWRLADRVITTRADPVRARPAQATAERIGKSHTGRVHAEPDPQKALQQAIDLTPAGGVVCACGSVYMAGQARTFAQLSP